MKFIDVYLYSYFIMEPKKIKEWIKSKKDHRKQMDPKLLFNGIIKGDLNSLSLGITLIESYNQNQRKASDDLIQRCLPYSGNSIRIGISSLTIVITIFKFSNVFISIGKVKGSKTMFLIVFIFSNILLSLPFS